MKTLEKVLTADSNLDYALLVYRVALSLSLILTHGLKNITHFNDASNSLPDPFGFGTIYSVLMAIFSDVICAVFVMLGLYTRLAIIPILLLTLTGLFVVHLHDPAVVRDVPFMYALSYGLLLYLGPGKFSLDKKNHHHPIGFSFRQTYQCQLINHESKYFRHTSYNRNCRRRTKKS